MAYKVIGLAQPTVRHGVPLPSDGLRVLPISGSFETMAEKRSKRQLKSLYAQRGRDLNERLSLLSGQAGLAFIPAFAGFYVVICEKGQCRFLGFLY